MRVLFVSSGNFKDWISPFVKEQGESLKKAGISVDYFPIKGHGIFGYLSHLPRLKKKIKREIYDLIHAHYGISGLLCVLQRKLPVVVTFHGGDFYFEKSNVFYQILCWFSALFSSWNIFVNHCDVSRGK